MSLKDGGSFFLRNCVCSPLPHSQCINFVSLNMGLTCAHKPRHVLCQCWSVSLLIWKRFLVYLKRPAPCLLWCFCFFWTSILLWRLRCECSAPHQDLAVGSWACHVRTPLMPLIVLHLKRIIPHAYHYFLSWNSGKLVAKLCESLFKYPSACSTGHHVSNISI